MSEKLPYEIISSILEPLLRVADNLFVAQLDAPFGCYTPSTSNYLLVSKKWLHSGTPLLYQTVVLRSHGQAEALAAVLASQPEFGLLIKKLRVEGAYGDAMLPIFTGAPNISDLCLSFDIFPTESTAGLCKGLRTMNPRRLILHYVEGRENKMVANLVAALEEVIVNSWSNLTCFVCPTTLNDWWRDNSVERPRIFASLDAARRLQSFHVSLSHHLDLLYSFLKNCPLQSVSYQGTLNFSRGGRDPTLQRLARDFEQRRAASIRAAEREAEMRVFTWLKTPMHGEPQGIQDAIWSRILQFVFAARPTQGHPATKGSRTNILRVCKMFLRVGRDHFYSHIALNRDEGFEVFHRLISDTTRPFKVESVSADWAPWDIFETLLQRTGPSLVECTIYALAPRDQGTPAAQKLGLVFYRTVDGPQLLSRMPNLRRLKWACNTKFGESNGGELAKLEELQITAAHETFVDLLTSSRLPSLRIFCGEGDAFDYRPFLSTHGAALTRLHLPISILESIANEKNITLAAICPNLVELYFIFGKSPTSHHFAPPKKIFLPRKATSKKKRPSSTPLATLQHLREITFTGTTTNDGSIIYVQFPDERAKLVAWKGYLQRFDQSQCPRLERIRIPTLSWPATERDIELSPMVHAAEALLDKGISLTGKNGVAWRRRVQRRGLEARPRVATSRR
ncbi:hypothetical protein MKEN_00738600 [Mycena kentingensis (nom. inval.)]|nr:hypothetical protein MKEN_00738600 [Mycena kentingensis (nom. inval.)]